MALDFFAGCLGGCAGIMVGYPLDTIKVHMQTQDHRNPKFRSSWHCFHTLFAKESVAGLYRGITSPIAGVAVVNAIVFGIYGHTQRNLSEPDHLSSHFIAGVSAGVAQTPVCSPIELAKTRLQLQSPKDGTFTGPMHCLRHIYKTEGYRGIFRGLGITFLREAPSYGFYFLTYEALTRTSNNEPISTPYMLLAGGLAGTASWVISYPLDVIKSRIQAENSNRYAGALDCLRQSIKAEGYTCLYKGLNSTILRAFPTNAATFAVVTWTFRIFGEEANTDRKLDAKPGVVQGIPVIQERHAPFFSKWNTFLNQVSNDKVLSRSYYSTLSTLSESGLILGDSASCQTDRLRQVAIKYATVKQTRDVECSDDAKEELKCEEESRDVTDDSERKVEWADVEQRIAECSLHASRIIIASDFTNSGILAENVITENG